MFPFQNSHYKHLKITAFPEMKFMWSIIYWEQNSSLKPLWLWPAHVKDHCEIHNRSDCIFMQLQCILCNLIIMQSHTALSELIKQVTSQLLSNTVLNNGVFFLIYFMHEKTFRHEKKHFRSRVPQKSVGEQRYNLVFYYVLYYDYGCNKNELIAIGSHPRRVSYSIGLYKSGCLTWSRLNYRLISANYITNNYLAITAQSKSFNLLSHRVKWAWISAVQLSQRSFYSCGIWA